VSSDGTRIAFYSDRDGTFEIYVMNADGGGQTRLTNNPASDDSPSWSPDGTRIAFYPDRDGNGQTNLTNNPAGDQNPSWGP